MAFEAARRAPSPVVRWGHAQASHVLLPLTGRLPRRRSRKAVRPWTPRPQDQGRRCRAGSDARRWCCRPSAHGRYLTHVSASVSRPARRLERQTGDRDPQLLPDLPPALHAGRGPLLDPVPHLRESAHPRQQAPHGRIQAVRSAGCRRRHPEPTATRPTGATPTTALKTLRRS